MKPITVKAEALEVLKQELRDAIPAGTTVYHILRNVARSGMSRTISPMVITNGEPRFWEYKIAQLLGYSLDKSQGIIMRGAGMDMGFHLVYSLSKALYDDGYALKSSWL